MKKFILNLLALIVAATSFAQFQIGRTTITFNDPTRTGGFGSGGGPGRQIQTEIYYPANTSGINVAVASGQFPVITFGHGFAMAWDAYQNIWEELVPRGYILAFPRTEGSLIPAPSHLNFGLDLALVNDRMLAFNTNQSSLFFGKIMPKSAIMGHSMGGGCSFIAGANTTNVTTIVGFAPAETNPSAVTAAASVNVPTLVLSGSADGVTPPAQHHIPIFEATASNCKYFVNIIGGAHCYYNNTNFNCDFGESTSSPNISITRLEQQQTTYDIINPWLDYILKGQCNQLTSFQNLLATDTRITSVTECTLEQPVIASSNGNNFCEGQSTVLSVPNGSNNLIWSTGATASTLTVTQAGTYFVVDAVSCQQSADFVITVNPLPNAPQISADGATTFCEGGSVNLYAIGQGSLTWSNNATGNSITVTSSGTFTATATANGCTSQPSNSIQVVVNPNPTPVITENALGQLEAGSTGVSYQWFLNGNSIPGANSFVYTPNANGIYTVAVTSANNCVGISPEFNFEKLGITNILQNDAFVVFPIPASYYLEITLIDESLINSPVSIINIEGKVLMSDSLPYKTSKLNLSELPSGIYFLKVGNAYKKIMVK